MSASRLARVLHDAGELHDRCRIVEVAPLRRGRHGDVVVHQEDQRPPPLGRKLQSRRHLLREQRAGPPRGGGRWWPYRCRAGAARGRARRGRRGSRTTRGSPQSACCPVRAGRRVFSMHTRVCSSAEYRWKNSCCTRQVNSPNSGRYAPSRSTSCIARKIRPTWPRRERIAMNVSLAARAYWNVRLASQSRRRRSCCNSEEIRRLRVCACSKTRSSRIGSRLNTSRVSE